MNIYTSPAHADKPPKTSCPAIFLCTSEFPRAVPFRPCLLSLRLVQQVPDTLRDKGGFRRLISRQPHLLTKDAKRDGRDVVFEADTQRFRRLHTNAWPERAETARMSRSL